MGQREHLSASEFLDAESGIHIPNLEENYTFLAADGQLLKHTLPNLMQIMLQHNLLSNILSLEGLTNDTFLKEAMK